MWFPDFKEPSSEDQKADLERPCAQASSGQAATQKNPALHWPVPLLLVCWLHGALALPSAEVCLQLGPACFPSSPPPPSSLLGSPPAERFVPTAHLIIGLFGWALGFIPVSSLSDTAGSPYLARNALKHIETRMWKSLAGSFSRQHLMEDLTME